MRALFVCPDMRRGGAERHWATLVPELAGRGAEVAVLCLAEEGELFAELVAAGVPARCAEMRRRSDPGGLRSALAAAAPAPDVVVSRGLSGQLVGLAIARRARAPHVLNEHTPLRADGELLPARPHQRLLTRLAARAVDAVIAVTGRQVEPLARLGYRRERIEVVPNGVFADRLQPATGRERARRELGLRGGDFAALCVAALRPEKRVERFVEAVRLAGDSHTPIVGMVAGEGRERERIEALAGGDGSPVRLLGARADVPDLMAAADAVCVTSEAEALPMTVLEAMALGRPVVATDVGGTSDAIADRDTGRLIDPRGDAGELAAVLADLAANPAQAAELGERGRARQAERFDGAAMVEGYLRALDRVAGR